jgi:transposase-like protein
MYKLLKEQGFVPKMVVTDKLRSYTRAFQRLIESTPQIQLRAGDAHHHLVQVLAIARSRASLAQPSRDRRPELQHPAP